MDARFARMEARFDALRRVVGGGGWPPGGGV